MLWLLLASLTAPAHADAFRLANGSVVEGTLATYELGGNCQIFVAAGPVRGATLLLPCAEILAFQRPGAEAPALVSAVPATAPAAALAVEEVRAPAPLVIPISEPEQAPGAASPAQEAPTALPAADEPVSASLPEGYALPGDDALAERAPVEDPPLAPPPANLRGTPRPAPRLDESAATGSEPADDGADDAGEEEVETPQEAPAGWREKGSGGMPRWLYRTIYGEEPPAPETDAQDG